MMSHMPEKVFQFEKEQKAYQENLKLIYQNILEQKRSQLDIWKSMDSKAGIVLGFILILISSIAICTLHHLLKTILLIPLTTSDICSIVSIYPRKYEDAPNPIVLFECFKNETVESSIEELCKQFNEDYKKNTEYTKNKNDALKLAYSSLIVFVLLVLATTLI